MKKIIAEARLDLKISASEARETLARLFRDTAREFRAMADNMEASALRLENDMAVVDSVPEWEEPLKCGLSFTRGYNEQVCNLTNGHGGSCARTGTS